MISKHILNLKVEYKSSIVHNHDSLGEMIIIILVHYEGVHLFYSQFV